MHTYKLKDGFHVGQFMKLVPVDYIFSYKQETNEYVILNDTIYGTFDKDMVESLSKKSRLVVINNNTLEMKVYNIPSHEMNYALLNM